MNFAFFLHLRYLFLICAFGLLTITPAAQIVSQNFNKSAEVGETPDKNETLEEKTGKDKIKVKNIEKETEKAQPAKPSRFASVGFAVHTGISF